MVHSFLLYLKGLLIWKIWQATKTGNNGGSTKQLQFLIRILMESGILYLLIGLAHFFAWFGRDGFGVALLGTIVSFETYIHSSRRISDNFFFARILLWSRLRLISF